MTNKYFTESEWMARYVKHPYFCPYCEAKELLSYGLEPGDDFATATVECRSCGKKWCEVYSLTAIEVTEDDLIESEVDYSADDQYAYSYADCENCGEPYETGGWNDDGNCVRHRH